MIVLSFLYRGTWRYGVIQNEPNLKRYIDYDGFDQQSKEIFELYLCCSTAKVPTVRKVSPEAEKEIRLRYENDGHYSSDDVDSIVKSYGEKKKIRFSRHLYLPIHAVYSNTDGWQYETVYTEKDIVSRKEKKTTGIECIWVSSMEELIKLFEGGSK